jgi:RNA polymerase sigma-70 factor (ECF subfamily)
VKRPEEPRAREGEVLQLDLVRRASAGDQDAFSRLAAGAVDRMYAIAYRILRDPDRAQDATQQALFGAWRDLPTLRDHDRFEAWLYRLVVHACYAESRSQRRHVARIRALPIDPPSMPDTAIAVADRDELEHAFRSLSPEQRAVVVLHHYLGYPLTEIAATLGIPSGTARSRLHYATRQLRAAIEAEHRLADIPKERPA